MKKIVCLFVCLFVFSSAHAGLIGVGSFSGSESIEDFSTLGTAPSPGSFNFGGMTFSETSSGSGSAGWRNLTTNNVLTDNAGISNITIDFDTAFSRIGLDVGFFPSNGSAAYDVSFFDTSLNLLGIASVSGIGGLFAGWEDASGISRINIFETSGENSFVGGVDNIRFENAVSNSNVPEPATLALLGLGLAGIGFSRKKKTA